MKIGHCIGLLLVSDNCNATLKEKWVVTFRYGIGKPIETSLLQWKKAMNCSHRNGVIVWHLHSGYIDDSRIVEGVRFICIQNRRKKTVFPRIEKSDIINYHSVVIIEALWAIDVGWWSKWRRITTFFWRI